MALAAGIIAIYSSRLIQPVLTPRKPPGCRGNWITAAYRLEVEDKASGAMASYRFYSGWRSYASGANTPDKAVLTLPEEPVKAGSRTKITLAAPYAGEALITVATDKVHSVQRVKLDGKPREITIETDASWGAGFYVMATVVTPRDAVNQPVPRRAMGVAYIPLDMSARKLSIKF